MSLINISETNLPQESKISQELKISEESKTIQETKPNDKIKTEPQIIYIQQPQSISKNICLNEYGRIFYSVFHTLMSFVAIYLSFRCNKGFSLGPFLVALCFPYIYIVYTLATKGTCGILERKI